MDPKIMMYPSGRVVDLTNLRPDDIDVSDIAHHLSMLCRFTGGVRSFYSVAQHSHLVSALLQYNGAPVHEQFLGLMHDATEAYFGDVSAPLKGQLGHYSVLEEAGWWAICDRLGLTYSSGSWLRMKDADNMAFVIEANALTARHEVYTGCLHMPPHETIRSQPPYEARAVFLHHYKELTQ